MVDIRASEGGFRDGTKHIIDIFKTFKKKIYRNIDPTFMVGRT